MMNNLLTKFRYIGFIRFLIDYRENITVFAAQKTDDNEKLTNVFINKEISRFNNSEVYSIIINKL